MRFEAAREPARADAPPPAGLVVVGAVAPHRRAPRPYVQPSAAELKRLWEQDGVELPAQAAADPDVVGFLMDLMRTDLRLVRPYVAPEHETLACPVMAVCGEKDSRNVDDDATQAWQVWADGPFLGRVCPGGHLNTLSARGAPVFWGLVVPFVERHTGRTTTE